MYDNFQGLDISDSAPGCLQEVLVLRHLEQFPLLGVLYLKMARQFLVQLRMGVTGWRLTRASTG